MTRHDQDLRYERILHRLDYLAKLMESDSTVKPTEQQYRDALVDVVQTLEAIKHAFKSKQLKALRERIELVLNQKQS